MLSSKQARFIGLVRRYSSIHTINASDPVIVDALRTPIGSFRCSLNSIPAPSLAAIVMRALVQRACVPPDFIQEVLMGNVLQAMVGQSPARQAVLGAGLPKCTEATTINKVCASGMKSIILACQSLTLGRQQFMIAGGMENMSMVPFYLKRGDTGYGRLCLEDGIVYDGLTDVYNQIHMGCCAENTAKNLGICRKAQDDYACQSYKRSAEAYANGCYKDELVEVQIPGKKGCPPTCFKEDEEFKRVNFEKFPKLPTVFQKDGTVTAGNASTLNDGAAACLLTTFFEAQKCNLRPIAKIVDYEEAATDPIDFPTAPVIAIPKLLARHCLKVDDIAHWEINEAFSVVPLAAIQMLCLDPARVNPHGGAVSLGHPIGMSGARLVVHLAHSLKPCQLGVAAICNGGGAASTVLIQRLPLERPEGVSLPRLTLFTKHPCSLCDELKEQLGPWKDRVEYNEVDISSPGNERWAKGYRYHIPVLHLEGRFLLWHRFDAQLMERRLAEIEESWGLR